MRGLLRLGICGLAVACGVAGAAETKWVQGHLGVTEIYSDGDSKRVLEKAGTFEEFRFALGTLLGKPELATDPPVRLLALRNPLATPGLLWGRDRIEIFIPLDGAVPGSVFRDATKVMLEQNIARLPDDIERGLIEFFSTIKVRGVHVLWGTPPAVGSRTLDWARIQLLATKPEYYGKFKVLMFNLLNGVADVAAYRNAIGKTKAEFEVEVAAYLKAGVFAASEGPSKPLNTQRDMAVKPLETTDAELAIADLLNSESRAKYEKMLASPRYFLPASEGLALLAIRDKDTESARRHLTNAIERRSRNGAIWLAYAQQEEDRPKANDALDEAIDLDPALAEAHYEKGLRRHILKELKTAATLQPRASRYWAALAEVYLDDNQFPEARRAWRSAEQASIIPEEKEKMHQAWMVIDKERLDYSDSEKKRTTGQKAEELQKLKDRALADLHASEAKINKGLGGVTPGAGGVPVVGWEEVQPISLTGVLKQVDCLGKQTRVTIEAPEQKIVKLALLDRKGLSCGAQKLRTVTVEYSPKVDAKLGTLGEVAVIPQ